MKEYDELEEEICDGCDGRGRCPDRPCVQEAMEKEEMESPVEQMLKNAFKSEELARQAFLMGAV